jgi:hypothetical protein
MGAHANGMENGDSRASRLTLRHGPRILDDGLEACRRPSAAVPALATEDFRRPIRTPVTAVHNPARAGPHQFQRVPHPMGHEHQELSHGNRGRRTPSSSSGDHH